MSKQLFIRLATTPDLPVGAAIVSNDPSGLQVLPTGPLAELSNYASHYPVIALMPAQLCTIVSNELPDAPLAQLRKAIPYAVEEQLSEDPEQLQFALGPELGNRHYAIAAVSKSLMSVWMKALSDAHITVNDIIIDGLALPLTDNQWTIFVDESTCLLRTSYAFSYFCYADELLSWLEVALQQSTHAPGIINIHLCKHAEFELTDIQKRYPHIRFQQLQQDSAWSLFAEGIEHTGKAFSLLQGDYRKKSAVKFDGSIKLALYGLLALVTLNVATAMTEVWVLGSKTRQLQTKIEQTYKQVFPNAATVVSPRLRFKRRFTELMERAEGSPWQQWMGHAAPVLQSDNIEVAEIDYTPKRLLLSVRAKQFTDLGNIVNQLQKSGLQVKQSNAITQGDHVTAKLEIQGGLL